jgi:hypothetical protein
VLLEDFAALLLCVGKIVVETLTEELFDKLPEDV